MSLRDQIIDQIEKDKQPNNKSKGSTKKPLEAKIATNRISSANAINLLRIETAFDKLFYMRENLEEERAGLHCSHIIKGDSEFCYRAAVLSLLFKQNQGEHISAGLKRIFAAGDNIHEKWQDFFDKSGKSEGMQIKGVGNEERAFSSIYETYYTPDSKIITLWDMYKYILEIKSMNTFAFKKAVAEPNPRKKHPKAFVQCQMYMHFEGIPFGIILLEDKNDQNYHVIFIQYDSEVVKPFIQRAQMVQTLKREFLSDGTLPQKKCKGCNDKKAKKCVMRDACFQVGIGRIKFKAK